MSHGPKPWGRGLHIDFCAQCKAYPCSCAKEPEKVLTPLADEVQSMWDRVKHNGEALGAIQAAIDETKGNVEGYPAAMRRICNIANEWEKKHG